MLPHTVIVGGGSALAQPLIRRHLDGGRVTAICRDTIPEMSGIPQSLHPRLVVAEPYDMGDARDAEMAFSTLTNSIDTLITLTGSVCNARLEDMKEYQWRAVMNSTLDAVYYSLRFGLPRVVRGGSVVVVGSVIGRTGGFGCANYAAAKAGLVGLVKTAALEYAAKGVRINLLECGYVDAGMGKALPDAVRERVLKTIPLGRFATEAEFVDAVLFLSRAYTTGGVLSLAGGL